MMAWDDLRYFLAVHRTGTLSAAARALGVNQSTVSRRLEALSRSFGAKLFERRDGRYLLSAAGRSALARAERIEQEVDTLVREIEHLDDRPEGSVRLSAPEGLGLAVIAPRLAAFHREHRGIELLLAAESPIVNLSRREADIALRFSRPEQRELVVRRAARVPFSLYASAEYLRRRPRTGDGPFAPGDEIVVLHEALADSPESVWMRAHAREARIRVRVRTTLALKVAITAGAGVGLLPVYLGNDPALRPLAQSPALTRDVFLLFHKDLRNTARVRIVSRFVTECLKSMGEDAGPLPAV